MDLSHPAIKDDFWRLIEDSFPDRDKVQEKLRALDEPSLVAFAAHVIVARNAVRQSDVPLVINDEELTSLTLADLTGWIVGRGEEFTKSATNASDGLLSRLYRVYLEQSSPDLLGEAFHAYTARFAGDFNDAVEQYAATLESSD